MILTCAQLGPQEFCWHGADSVLYSIVLRQQCSSAMNSLTWQIIQMVISLAYDDISGLRLMSCYEVWWLHLVCFFGKTSSWLLPFNKLTCRWKLHTWSSTCCSCLLHSARLSIILSTIIQDAFWRCLWCMQLASEGPEGANEQNSSAPIGFVWDPISSYYVCPESGMYYDPSSEFYFSSEDGRWYYLDSYTNKFVEVKTEKVVTDHF